MQTKEKLTPQNTRFEDLGFFIEHLIDGKLIGCIKVDTNDRDCIGYYSKREHIASKDIVFGKKRIKKGTNYQTRIYPLCGKVINK